MAPSAPPPMVHINPEHLDILQQRGMISPEAYAAAKARVLGLDAKLGLPQGRGFADMLAPGSGQGGGAELGNAPPPAAAPKAQAPAAKPKAPQKKLTPEQHKQADAWMKLADGIVWMNPRETPAGSTFNGVQARKMPQAALALLQQMYPDKAKADMVPMGWGEESLASLPPEQRAILAQLIIMGEREGKQKPAAQPPEVQIAGSR